MIRVNIATVPSVEGQSNEDHALALGNSVVVLDGQTARTDTGCIHGVAWFSGRVAATLIQELNSGQSPVQALSEAIQETSTQHKNTCDLTAPGTPSALVAACQIVDDELRYLVLGDLTLIIETQDDLLVLSDTRVSQSALAERAIADALPANHPDKPAALLAMKHAELAARNTPGGFWVAATNPEAANHSVTGTLPLRSVLRFAILSDGAARAVDPFASYTWPEVLDVIERIGPAQFIAEVRVTEASDPLATRWARNKISDDATVAYCAI